MSKEGRWPNNQRHRRDSAGDQVASTIIELEKLLKRVEDGQFTRAGLQTSLSKSLLGLHKAALHLQKAGAPIELD